MVYYLIDFCEFSEDNQEKQDENYSRMLTMDNYLKSLPLIKIKVCDDKFDFNTQDIDDFEDPFGIEFPSIYYYFKTIHFEEYSDFKIFYNTMKSDEVKKSLKTYLKLLMMQYIYKLINKYNSVLYYFLRLFLKII